MIINGQRLLDASEISVRLGNKLGDKGFNALLYKDARTDMKILDEKFTQFGWQKDYKVIDGKMFCGIGIFNKEIGQWIWKWDVGTETDIESEKGEASDAFKRAGVNLDIGRELYTAPQIPIWDTDKYKKYKVSSIGYNDNCEINQLEIVEEKTGNVVFTFGSKTTQKPRKVEKPVKKEEPKESVPNGDEIAPLEARQEIWNLMMKTFGYDKHGDEEVKAQSRGYAVKFLKKNCKVDNAGGITNSMVAYLNEKFSKPLAPEDFIDDEI